MAGEQDFIDSYLARNVGESKVFQCDVSLEVIKEGTLLKKSKSENQKRILVLGQYKIYLFEQGKKSSKKTIEINYLDLISIDAHDGQKAKITFKTSKGLNEINVLASNFKDIFKTLKIQYKKIAYHWPELPIQCPEKLVPKLDVIEVKSHIEPYINTYKAYCCYFNQPFSPLVVQYVENLEFKNVREFNFSELPGIDHAPGIKLTLHPNIEPIIMAFKYNQYFNSIVLNNIQRKDIGNLIAEVIKTNTSLTKLCLSNTDLDTTSLTPLVASLRENRNINIEIFDISDQKSFDNRHMQILSLSFSVYPHTITHLNLSNLNCSGKGLIKLFTSFQMNYSFSLGIKLLNLSGNKFDESVDIEFEKWADKVQSYSHLEDIILSNIVNIPIKTLHKMKKFLNLKSIDLSDNKIEQSDTKIICDFIKELPTLQKINLSNTFDKNGVQDQVMEAIKSMKCNEDISIDLSNNSSLSNESKWVKSLQSSKVAHLYLNGIHFKDSVLEHVLAYLKFAPNLKILTLNNCKTKPKRNETLLNLLNFSALTTLSMSDSFTNESIHSFLDYFSTLPQSSLKCLSIENNYIGDEAVHTLCKIIREDKYLEEIHLDGNSFSLNAWYAIYQSLLQNTRLVKIGYPMNNFNMILSAFSNDAKRTFMCKLIFDFQSLLQKLDTSKEAGRFIISTQDYETVPAPSSPSSPITVPSHLTSQQITSDLKLDETELSQSDSGDANEMFTVPQVQHQHIHVSEVFPPTPKEKPSVLPPPVPLKRSTSVYGQLPVSNKEPRNTLVRSASSILKPNDFFSAKYEQYEEDVDVDEPVRRATVNELVIRLSHENHTDTKFIHTLFMTYRASIEPEELFERLISRYFLKQPDNVKGKEAARKWNEQTLRPVRIRVMNALKHWIEAHCHDFMDYPDLADKLRKFLQCEEVQKNNGSSANQLINLLDRNMSIKLPELTSDSVIEELAPKINSLRDQGVISVCSVNEVAETLCILESDLFSRIQMKEFFNQSWNKGSQEERDLAAPNIRAMIKTSNRITTWYATEILRQTSASSRAKVITYLIKLGIVLRNKNNFNGVMEIYAALSLSAIIRLKKSWENVKQKYKQVYDEFSELANSSQSFGNLRNAVKASSTPLIPYLGLYLTDLVFIEEGNPETFDEDGITMVNFRKNEMLAEVLFEIQNYQQSRYNFQRYDPLYHMVLTYEPKTERELYNWSLDVEPREK